MANLRAIRKRVSSVKSTQQITRAMKMVSAAKLRRAQDAINAARPYARKMREVVQAVAARAGEDAHPLLTSREGKKLALLVVTSDRGLCGSFNSGLTRAVYRFLNEHRGEYEEITLFVVGRKGRDFFRRREIPIRKEYLGVLGSVSRHHAETVANDLVGGFLAGEFDEVQIAFNEFRSAISQIVRFEKMFPIALETPEGEADGASIDYLYEPGREEILASAAPEVRADDDLPRSPRIGGGGARRPDDGDGFGDEQLRRHDRPAHAADEPRAAGDDHHRAHRDRQRRRGVEGVSTKDPVSPFLSESGG